MLNYQRVSHGHENDLDDEFWGIMTWKPPFEWRFLSHTSRARSSLYAFVHGFFFPPEMGFTRHLLAV
jgi:hypothetical protein